MCDRRSPLERMFDACAHLRRIDLALKAWRFTESRTEPVLTKPPYDQWKAYE